MLSLRRATKTRKWVAGEAQKRSQNHWHGKHERSTTVTVHKWNYSGGHDLSNAACRRSEIRAHIRRVVLGAYWMVSWNDWERPLEFSGAQTRRRIWWKSDQSESTRKALRWTKTLQVSRLRWISCRENVLFVALMYLFAKVSRNKYYFFYFILKKQWKPKFYLFIVEKTCALRHTLKYKFVSVMY